MLEVIVSAVERICSGKHRGSRIQDSGDSSLGNRNSLLLHGFVDGDTILWTHFVEFVDADDATVGEDHRSAFQLEFSGSVVFDDGGCQTRC